MAASTNNNNLTNWKDGEPVAYISNQNSTTVGTSLNNLTFWKDGQPLNFIGVPGNALQQADFFLSLDL